MEIIILGPGCKNCETLAENTKKALVDLKKEARIEKVTDFMEIAKYGVLSTPGLVINGKVVSTGKVLKPKQIIKLIEKDNQD